MNSCFHPAEILLPREDIPVEEWACVACDQFTSEPEYWKQAEAVAEGKPSTLHLVLPEVYLNDGDVKERVARIQGTMKSYLDSVLTRTVNGFIYLERDQKNGYIRQGLIGAIDLDAYDYAKGSKPQIRPTESTVVSRIPPRLAVRRGAVLELPHVMMLVDDPEQSLIEPLAAAKQGLKKVYDGPLMMGGGSVKGWAIEDKDMIRRLVGILSGLGSQEAFDRKYPAAAGDTPLTLAVGDGNHSLATAKAHWEEIKATLTPEQQADHPARRCLVEICNVHSPAIQIEPIHRVVFRCGGRAFLDTFAGLCEQAGVGLVTGEEAASCPQRSTFLYEGGEVAVGFKTPKEPLTVGTVQKLIDRYLETASGASVDYIHGDDSCRELAKGDACGFMMPPFDKSDIFKGVVLGGVLPRKTFSMGHAFQKRYYLECRRIDG